ncbi:hypothetical protein [Chitinophaga nivalis]|uniref:DUF2207 domain-containing protein n=1 Tax=Chitinophaga nivalis TaxID=2991709 RepID=A0ABT3IMU6_9BACT|nr:hypothetical protein [Chitinophaga nivalis]MCW3465029.1 hypothetical protein [Chitinophaga nivalis]MCW3485279.1 hypothetical protein [Chitinophaga nivalis]
MNLFRYKHRRAERFPFRQLATTSFITGALAILLGIVLLLSVKSAIIAHQPVKTGAKIIAGLGMILLGVKDLKRGYINEYKFDLDDAYNPAQKNHINDLMGQRRNKHHRLAYIYADILQSKSYALNDSEKRPISAWQKIFYELLSQGKLTKVIDLLPYPITNFIVNQSTPLAIVGYFLLSLCVLFFCAWLGLITINMTLINLFLFTGLLSLWKPSGIDNVLRADRKKDLREKLILFILAFLATLTLYKTYTSAINSGVFISVLFLAAVMVTTAILAFRVINHIFSSRDKPLIVASEIQAHTYRANTQPNNILNQFDNMIGEKTNWFFKEATKDAQGVISGSQHNKGDFEFEYVYETLPVLIPSPHDATSESLLKYTWGLGTVLLSVGLLFFFAGIMTTPGVNISALQTNPEGMLTDNAPGIFLSLYFTLLGLAIFFFGRKLVYEIYLFFHTEIFFESNLIVFKATGNYDEFEQISGNIKRKDTCTDYTPGIKVCKVISSVFMHPYMTTTAIPQQPRFLVKVEKQDALLQDLWQGFQAKMQHYTVAYLP